ncbi:LysO family transporter [Desulfovibrio sp. ZJ200]|uniref:LysO family transporter n=1 Tax=Desulfovibrio sp. ZJ200 TaxID=2709792 RepID=UPI0013EB37E6|nr:LysO family transporter [Desulfovibrio sp. ZJ200]
MFIAIGIMFLGLLLGFLLRGQRLLTALTRCVTPAIMLLLFSLGVAVGGNETLMRNLPLLGGKALLLTLAGVAGSLACVAVIRRWFCDLPATPCPRAGRKSDGKTPRPQRGQ